MLNVLPFAILSFTSAIFLFFVYLYLFNADRKNYLGLWSLGWGAYAFKYIFLLFSLLSYYFPMLPIGENLSYLLSIILIVLGIYSFLDQKPSKVWIAVFLIHIVYILIGAFKSLPFLIYTLPIYLFFGAIYVWLGLVYMKHIYTEYYGRYLIGISFIALGIFTSCYPFLHDFSWFTPWEYLLNGFFVFLIGISLMMLYFRRVKNELKESEDRYRLVIDLLPDAIFVHCDGEITYCNRSALNLLGFKDINEVKGKIFSDYVAIDKRHQFIEYIASIPGNPGIRMNEWDLSKTNGSIIHTEISSTVFPTNTGFEILSIVRDITGQKLSKELQKNVAEKTRQLNAAVELDKIKTEFFANISHELRTPLNIMLSSLQLFELYMSKKLLVDNEIKFSKYIYSMKQNSYRLLRLVNNLIDLTKIDSGYYEINKKNIDIVKFVDEICLSIADYVENKGIILIFHTDIEEKIIACDPDAIERVILNLLSNAVKFTKAGGHIYFNVSYVDSKIRISVRDTGIGISKENLGFIFQRFRQVDKSLARSYEGSGIGLSLVKSLVEMHGGNVTAESEPNNGSTFIVELPDLVLPSSAVSSNNIPISYKDLINIEFSDL